MRKAQKEQILEIFLTLGEAHVAIRNYIENKEFETVFALLEDCQQTAITIGGMIEETEGEEHSSVRALEDYCERVYQVGQGLAENMSAQKAYKMLHKSLIQVGNSVENDVSVCLEVVFLPYKASMWDSLESVWRAADEDPDCDAYVIPIPYYDRNPDLSFGAYHYEGHQFPEDVPITYYEAYNLEKRRPDVIYIHNPYDATNYVTSIDPRFYSYELEKFTECLVYIPYFSNAGNVGEAWRNCPAYHHVNYIVTQSEQQRKFFDSGIPDKKFLHFGSPKFDRILHSCKNPPEPEDNWKKVMLGKKVYFYNTSINGMLMNTPAFLRKMKYVFECFVGREDACLLWRPHPLLESSFASMRPELLNTYLQLKQFFIHNQLGIYDDTSDMDSSIALSDVYIGDAWSSLVSLFGIAGKPIFILDNMLDIPPDDSDWLGHAIQGAGDGKWTLVHGNQLYYSPGNTNYEYEHFATLAKNASDNLANIAVLGNKVFSCVFSEQSITVFEGDTIKKIELEQHEIQNLSFCAICYDWEYLVLIPYYYPALVCYHIESGTVRYFRNNLDVFIADRDGKRFVGGCCIYNGNIYISSPIDTCILVTNLKTGDQRVEYVGSSNAGGAVAMYIEQNDIWLLPHKGNVIRRWTLDTGGVKEYSDYPAGFECRHPVHKYLCNELPFGQAAFTEKHVFFSGYYSNMCIRLNRETGVITEYKPPFLSPEKYKNCYYFFPYRYQFLQKTKPDTYLIFSGYDRRLYEVNLETGSYSEHEIKFDKNDVMAHEPGFSPQYKNLQYACMENVFNSLPNFLDGKIVGAPFERDKQLAAYKEISTNLNGTCGESIHRYITKQIKLSRG